MWDFVTFVVVIDYVMKKVARETGAGIVWWEERKLLNLDYADDIVLFSEREDMQKVPECLVREGKKIGLVIYCAKTEIMDMKIGNPRDCVIDGRIVKKIKS